MSLFRQNVLWTWEFRKGPSSVDSNTGLDRKSWFCRRRHFPAMCSIPHELNPQSSPWAWRWWELKPRLAGRELLLFHENQGLSPVAALWIQPSELCGTKSSLKRTQQSSRWGQCRKHRHPNSACPTLKNKPKNPKFFKPLLIVITFK